LEYSPLSPLFSALFFYAAKRDYRDVLFWAEYPEESRLDTPEKRERVRKMFEKFGIKPPGDL
jgi:hypothetical protein